MKKSTVFSLKPISSKAISAALDKAMRYRLLNEPEHARSICRDILLVEPNNQQALVILILSITDGFKTSTNEAGVARDLVVRLESEYERLYYSGIILERQAIAMLQRAIPGGGYAAYELLNEAMTQYETAEVIRPEGNDDAILRWNSCARIIMRNALEAKSQEVVQPYLE